jgi:hypothetical protein
MLLMSDQPAVPSGPKEVPLERVDRKPLWPVNPTSALMLAGTSVLLLVARSFLTRLAHHLGQHSADLAAKRMFSGRPTVQPKTDAEEVTLWMMIRVRRK